MQVDIPKTRMWPRYCHLGTAKHSRSAQRRHNHLWIKHHHFNIKSFIQAKKTLDASTKSQHNLSTLQRISWQHAKINSQMTFALTKLTDSDSDLLES